MRPTPSVTAFIATLLLTLLSSASLAADNFSSAGNSLSGSSTSFDNSQEFLPVEDAYRALLTPTPSGLDIDWQIEPGYYLYQERFNVVVTTPNADPSAPAQSFELTPTFEQGKTKYDEYFEKEVTVYYLQTRTPVSWPAELPDTNPLALKITSQGCADAGLCYPPHHNYFQLDRTSAVITPIDKSAYDQLIGKSSAPVSTTQAQPPASTFILSQWLWVLVLACAGGAILNLMPCVFPVLSIKALKLANSAEAPHTIHLHGWAYTVGTVLTFVVIAAAMLGLRSAGAAIGWGFQLQSPIVISILAYLFFTMGLSFSGAIQLGSQFMGIGQTATSGNGYRASFFTGALAAIVASPCTAPMMGTALGYAITQPAAIALSVFAALGFGMALPFLLLTYSPALARWLPKPGQWMNTLKQAMAFPLYLTALWLLWVLGRQTNSSTLVLVACGFIAIAFALWILQQPTQHHLSTWLKRGTAVAALAMAVFLIPHNNDTEIKQASGHTWQPYSAARLASLRQQGKAVMINLTADWCITCIANERVALHTPEVDSALKSYGIETLKGDWTTADPEITKLLKAYGRSGVPLYLMFPASGADATILPQLLTKATVIDAIKRAANHEIAENIAH